MSINETNQDPTLGFTNASLDAIQTQGREIVEERKQHSKVFALGRNNYQSVIYPKPVHFKNAANDTWEEIDNTLIAGKSIAGDSVLSNKANSFTINMKPANSGKLIEIVDSKNRAISWTVVGEKSAAACILPKAQRLEKNALYERALKNLEDTALYANILPDTDLKCSILCDHFKDEIILKSRAANPNVTFCVTAPKLELIQREDGSIWVADSFESAEPVFVLPPPYMTDSGEAKNVGQVRTTLERKGETWLLTYLPDQAWLDKATYPVIIDPVVKPWQETNYIQDNYVTSLQPGTVMPYTSGTLRVANTTGYGDCRAFLRFAQDNLKVIDSSFYITKAYLNLGIKETTTATVPVFLHEVQGDWSSSTITWNNKPPVASMHTDYVTVAQGVTLGTRYQFDISNLVRKWYAGTNFGIMLDVHKAAPNTVDFCSSDALYHMPYVLINYLSMAGLEGYMDYESHEMGRAGTAHIGLYNGNMVFTRNLVNTTGNLMPLSVTAVNNSCQVNDPRLVGLGMPKGWRLSAHQMLHRETIAGADGNVTYYVYTDEDGTEHFFKKPTPSSTFYEDMSGLSLKLTEFINEASEQQVKITDKGDTVMVFDRPTADYTAASNNRTMLESIADAYGTKATFTYASGKLTAAKDGAGREIFFYYTNNILSSIAAPGRGTTIRFGLDENGDWGTITDFDEQVANYWYATDHTLTYVEDADGRYMHVEFSRGSEADAWRVVSYEENNEAGGDMTLGNLRTYDYGDCMTTITDCTTASEKKLVYQFNDNGNVVSIKDELGYATFTKFNDSQPVNNPEIASKLQRTVVNLTRNHGFETTSYWLNTLASGATGTFSYDTSTKRIGTRSRKMDKTNATGTMYTYQTIAVTPNKTYTASTYVLTSGAVKAYIKASCTSSTGTTWFTGDSLTATEGWERLSLTFQVAPDSLSTNDVVIQLIVENGPGAGWFDCVQFEEGAIPNRYNMLENGDFSWNSGAAPTAWLINPDNTGSDVVINTADPGKPSNLSANRMRIYGDPDKDAGIFQDLPLSGVAGDVYVAGGWSKGYSNPIKGIKNYNIRVAFKNGSTWHNSNSIHWSDEWTDWKFAAGAAVAPVSYTAVRFNVDYEENINYADFDGMMLYKEEFGKTFAYDENKNIVSVKTLAGEKSGAVYDSFNNMTEYRQPGRDTTVKYTLNYGSTDTEKKKHRLLMSTSPVGVVETFLYDEKGNQTQAQTQNTATNPTSFIRSSTTYTDKNYVHTTTDARNKTVTSNMDTDIGVLESVVDPNGQMVSYTYDALDRVKTTTAIADGRTYKNAYEYTNNKLTQVRHNTSDVDTDDVVYNFAYDGLGNPTTVKVGEQLLSQKVYTPGRDKLLDRVEFGNGGKASYIYDDFKRVKAVRIDNEATDRYTYEYDDNGTVGQVKDNKLGRTTWNDYDASNRLMQVRQYSGSTHLYTSTLGYDKYNNLQSLKERVGTDKFTTTYEYDNANRSTVVQFGAADKKAAYTYDTVGRISGRTVTNSSATHTATYGFVAGAYGPGSTTPLIASIAQPNQTLSYTYDNVGNVTSETRNGFTTNYEYDLLNQLTRVNDQRANETWVYDYDLGGNMKKRTRYAYTLGTPSGALGGDDYTYNGVWKDRMDKRMLNFWYELPITYDAIGNMTSYAGWEYTWEGRDLVRQVQGTTRDVQYKYDPNGIRIQKICNGHITNYTVHGKKIVHLTVGSSHTLHFFYDAQSKVAMTRYNGNDYTYVYNLQGDVIALLDSSGNQVVEYTYDAWGYKKSVTGSMASSLGYYNPFRYRGYVFDEETYMYYLNNRYYYPELQRFINPDALLGRPECNLHHNVFAYAVNNPITNGDYDGLFVFTLLGAVIGAATGAIMAACTGGNVGASLWGGAVSGAINGAATDIITFVGGGFLAPYAGYIYTAAGAIGNAAGEYVTQGLDKGWSNVDGGKIFVAGVTGALIGYGSSKVIPNIRTSMEPIFDKGIKGLNQMIAPGIYSGNITNQVGYTFLSNAENAINGMVTASIVYNVTTQAVDTVVRGNKSKDNKKGIGGATGISYNTVLKSNM